MEPVALYKRAISLDILQAQVTACALIEEADGSRRIEVRERSSDQCGNAIRVFELIW